MKNKRLTPFFSIVIPTYNSVTVIEDCLESIFSQTIYDYEVCIIDNLSSDGTLDIVKKYKEKGMELQCLSEKDNGIYDALNKGLMMVRGGWILFLGSDDSLFQEKILEQIQQEISKTQDKIIYGNVKIHGDTGWAIDGAIYDGEFNIQKLLRKNICHQAIFYNRDFVLSEIGEYNLKYPISSDWDFNLRCFAKKEFRHIPITIANFNAGGISTSATDNNFSIDFVDNICNYFSMDVFNPLLNNSRFIAYNDVLIKQKQQNLIRYYFGKLEKKFYKILFDLK